MRSTPRVEGDTLSLVDSGSRGGGDTWLISDTLRPNSESLAGISSPGALRGHLVWHLEAAPHLPRHLLFAMVAYRIQADIMGDLDAETVRYLKKIGLARSSVEAIPLTNAFDRRRRELLPGTVLQREWKGQNHRVMVVDNGFCWEGRSYDSLSRIACAITGTKWNGPRFFGLRDSRPAEVQQ